jgi:flagellar hook-associated protein 1
MLGLNAGLSALTSSQTAMDVIAGNIANANTPGYHRQVPHQIESLSVYDGQFWRGTGVEISRINQIASRAIESALTGNIANSNRVDQTLSLARQVENQLSPGDGSISQRLSEFFDELHQLQGQPDSNTQRRIVVNKSQSLAHELNNLSGGLERLRSSIKQDITVQVSAVITRAQALGQQPNGLLDNHQQLVNEIAEFIDIEAIPAGSGNGFSYKFAQGHISISQSAFTVAAEFNNDGTVDFRQGNSETPLEFGGGRLAGHQQSLNSLIPDYENRINELASSIIQTVDHIQSTGVNSEGPFSRMVGTRIAKRVDVPLSQAGLPFDIKNGELFISVYDKSTGDRSQHRIEIKPGTQSLEALASVISLIPNIQAVVDPVSRQLSLISSPGFGFDFSGQIPTTANRTNVIGDASIQFEGMFSGSTNQPMNFRVEGAGEVGVTPGLTLVHTNDVGEEIGRFNIGAGYEPDSSMELGNGLSIALGPGQLKDGDSFSAVGVADADTSNVLVALGLNSFFEGTSAGDIRVAPGIVDKPGRLSTGRSSDSGDGSNIKRFLDIRSQTMANTGQTIEEHLDETRSNIAIEVNGLTTHQSELGVLQNSLIRERESVSGVDPNEEMIHLLQYQRSFQAAVRVITTIDETLVELMSMLR